MQHDAVLLTSFANTTLTALAGGSVEYGNDTFSTIFGIKTLNTPAGTITGSTINFTIAVPAITWLANGTITKMRYKNSSGVVKVDNLTAGPLVVDQENPEVTVDNPTVVQDQTGTVVSLAIAYT